MLLHIWVIALFVALVLRDSLQQPLVSGWLSDAWIAGITLGAMVLVGVVTHVTVAIATSTLKRRGSWRAVLIGEGAVGMARWAVAVVHVAAVLVLGWLDVVRRAIGEVVVLDEALALAPAIGVFAWGWAALWPMERALREATMVRRLDTGAPVYPTPGRLEYAAINIRHHVLVWLTPLFLILAWTETVQRITAALAERGGWFQPLRDGGTRGTVNAIAELVGVAAVFLVVGPLAMRFVWDTVRLDADDSGSGLRERLTALCARYRVRISGVFVWRTHGTMINGAVLGLTPAFRYVLLTDALLDSLPAEEVEAVMAHEVAHVRHRHIVWLAVVMAATVTATAWLAETALRWGGANFSGIADEAIPEWMALAIAAGSFAAAMVLFGIVSRRFEWQADAFAAGYMSDRLRMLADPDDQGGTITHDGAQAMADALRSVARLNHVPMDRSSWRHGSIGTRIERLGALIGAPVGKTPIDRTSRRIKRVAFAAVLCVGGLIALQFISGG